jgi:hypothetical protein
MRIIPLLAAGLLTACVSTPNADVSMTKTVSATATSGRAPAPTNGFGLTAPARAAHANADVGRDFLDLAFTMESGRPLPLLTRFEGPITVRMTGPVPTTAKTDLSRLLQRFRNEAGLNIEQVGGGAASITIEFVPRAAIKATYSDVACFVVPRVSSWSEFRSARNTGALDWATLQQRDQVAVFIPADSSAQEVRDCLHEETAQALGPLNDLFRLTDSVFNDDNFNTSLTGFDMTILRAYYAPELRSGMTRAQVAAALPGILARVNPAGRNAAPQAQTASPRAWIAAIQTALGPNATAQRREASARQAVATARAQGWTDGRLAFSYFILGRLAAGHDAKAAATAFGNAGRIYRSLPGGAIHAALVDMQLAAFALAQQDPNTAIQIADRTLPVVAAAENAALVATLMMVKAEALEMTGRKPEAAALRIDSHGWARYGFGSDAQIQARVAEISALARRGNKS